MVIPTKSQVGHLSLGSDISIMRFKPGQDAEQSEETSLKHDQLYL